MCLCCALRLSYFHILFCTHLKEKPVRNAHTSVGAGGVGAIVNHLMMNSPALHGGFGASVLLLTHWLGKLYKKFILP